MPQSHMALVALFLLGSCGERRSHQACSENSPADLQRILSSKLTDANLRASFEIATAQENAGVMAIPAYPLCWVLSSIAAQASEHQPTRDALARAGLTPAEYAATLINIAAYRQPQQLGWPDRQRWSTTMLANERAVARFDHALAAEERTKHVEAKSQKD